jgi:hypothetical protein
MEEGWICIYRADEEYKAEIIKQLLEKQELHPVMMDHKDDEFRIGQVELYISPQEYETAKMVIKKNQEPV